MYMIMTQQEFTERTGLTITAQEFVKINNTYMAAGDMDKDEFCKEYLKHGNSNLVTILALMVIEKERQKIQLQKEREQIVDFLIEQAEKWSATDLRDKAIKMIGAKEYLIRKIKKGFNLWEADKELIVESLKS